MRNIFSILILCVLGSCKKFIAIDPPSTQLVTQTVFENDATATAAQLSIYARMEGEGMVYQQILYPGLSADEFSNYSTQSVSIDVASNNLTADNPVLLTFWNNYYKYIYQANDMLKGIAASPSLSGAVRNSLTGEAKFIRAFCHFYLVNLFGDIPVVRTTDYRVNAVAPRSSVSSVYDFITEDLLSAITELPADYRDASNLVTTERVRPTKSAARALLARVALYREQWNVAEQRATEVITGYYQLVMNPDNVFLKNSTEAIWQLQSVVPNFNTYPGAQLIFTGTPTVAALDTNLVKSFAATDKRKNAWTKLLTVSSKNYYYPYKYKVRTSTTISEYSMVLRLAEQYLVRAEARLKQGNLTGAEQDLNVIRARAGLSSLNGLPAPALLDSIQRERKFELFAEYSDRWLNLKRTATVNTAMTAVKGTNWVSADALWPIPQTELNRNPFLTQNPGY